MSKKSRQMVKEELLEAAEKLVEEMLEWQAAHPESEFEALEKLVLELLRRFGERVANTLLEIQEQRLPVSEPQCPECEEPLEYKDTQPLSFESLLGPLSVGRGSLDEQLRLPAKHWSNGVVRQITWLNGHTQTYGETTEILCEMTDAHISESSAWRLVPAWGGKLGTEMAAEEAQVKAEAGAWSTPGGPRAERGRMGVATDGGKMFIVGEGGKEFKAGCVFDVESEERATPPAGDIEAYGHAVNLSYTVHLGGPETTGGQLWTEAQRRGWRDAADGIVVGDGARWIWKLRDEHFPGTEMVVDWYHATEHLHAVKHLLYPEGGAAASRWYNTQKTSLYQGHAKRVAGEIRNAAPRHPDHSEDLHREANYFYHNHARMQYQRLREDRWPIGSGMVESGVKRFKARFDGAGMRWSRAGAENLLPVRAAVLSGKARFDQLWERARAA